MIKSLDVSKQARI